MRYSEACHSQVFTTVFPEHSYILHHAFFTEGQIFIYIFSRSQSDQQHFNLSPSEWLKQKEWVRKRDQHIAVILLDHKSALWSPVLQWFTYIMIAQKFQLWSGPRYSRHCFSKERGMSPTPNHVNPVCNHVPASSCLSFITPCSHQFSLTPFITSTAMVPISLTQALTGGRKEASTTFPEALEVVA